MRTLEKLWRNNRGIEGLPIRLVIALVVGVASLAIMTSILGGLPTFETTEVSVEYNNSTVKSATDDTGGVQIRAVDDQGQPVQNSTLVISSGSLSVEGDTYVQDLDGGTQNNMANVSFADSSYGSSGNADVVTDLRQDQNTGELTVEINPPSDGNYEDSKDNDEILLVR